jgi:fluoride exporter
VIVERESLASRVRRLDTRELVAIFAGGAIGAAIRTALLEAAPTRPGSWPWVTFGVNVAGSLLLGYLACRLQERLPVTAYRRPLLGTGLCGALTTFSSFQLDLLRLLDHGRALPAILYLAGSLGAGFAGFSIATAAVRRARLTW